MFDVRLIILISSGFIPHKLRSLKFALSISVFLHKLCEHLFSSFDAFTAIHFPRELFLAVLTWGVICPLKLDLVHKVNSWIITVRRDYEVNNFLIILPQILNLGLLNKGFELKCDRGSGWGLDSQLIVGRGAISQEIRIVRYHLGCRLLLAVNCIIWHIWLLIAQMRKVKVC